jgi:hypothetical protein
MIRSTLLLALCLAAMPAQARSAHLLAPDDAPVAGSPAAPAVTPAPSVASATSAADTHHLSGTTHFLISAGVGVFAVPGSLLLSSFLGGLPLTIAGSDLASLLLSGLPALLVMGFAAPLVVTFVAYTLGKLADPGRYSFGAAFWLSSLVNIVALVAGGALGLSVGVPLRLMLFSLIDGVLIGGTSVGVMRMFEKAPAPVASFVPGVSETRVVPLAQVAF